jgi:hypothetical protein
MARYSKKSGEEVKKAVHKQKRGQLKSGRSGKKVTSRKQAVAIGLSEGRKAPKFQRRNLPPDPPRKRVRNLRKVRTGP